MRITLDRFSGDRDRIAHRFALVAVNASGSGAGTEVRLTPAMWLENLSRAAERHMPRLRPSKPKGIGGIQYREGVYEKDMDDLGITATTTNIVLSSLLSKNQTRTSVSHEHQGREWYFNAGMVRRLDQLIRKHTERDIVVTAILLVTSNNDLLVHLEYLDNGRYSMANLTTAESVDAFRAAVSFPAERYSREEKANGWITHWILFNEVDYGWVDHPQECGLKLGLRTLPDADNPHGQRKEPVLEVFGSFGTRNFDSIVDKYKGTISIFCWSDILIDPKKVTRD